MNNDVNKSNRVNDIVAIIKKFAELTKKDDKSIVERGLKATEEMGELAQAILSKSKINGCEYKKLSHDEIMEECVDVLMVVTSIILQNSDFQFDMDYLLKVLKEKINKWENVILYKERELS